MERNGFSLRERERERERERKRERKRGQIERCTNKEIDKQTD